MNTTVAVPPVAERVVRPPKASVLWAIALAGLILSVLAAVFGLTNSDVDDQQMVLYLWMIVPYTVAGLIAWSRRPQSRLGLLLIAGGLATGLSALQFSNHSLPYTIGAALDLLPAAILLHVFLAFPDGRLRSRFERILVAIAYPAAVGVQVFRLTLGSSDNLMEIGAATEVADDARTLGLILLSGILLMGMGVLAVRRRHSGRGRRRALALVIDLCALGMLLAAARSSGRRASTARTSSRSSERRGSSSGLAPIVFLIGLLDARLARSAVGDLIVELRTDLPPAELEGAVARALRDPSLTLAYWLPEFETTSTWKGGGSRCRAPDGRVTTPIDRTACTLPRCFTTRARRGAGAARSGSAAAGIALENGRLQAELAARLEEVKGSRRGVIEAGQKERQRLERDLHDGAQQRLVALSLDLSLLGASSRGSDASMRARSGAAEIAASLAELREIARGIHPAVVSGHGLGVALEQLTALAPVPVRLTVAIEDRLPEALEVAAYYLVSESLANIGKYAQATVGDRRRRSSERPWWSSR